MDPEFTIPGLVIESVLGEGSNGRVYLAQHQILQKKVAVKVLHAAKGADESARLRFQREAQFLSKIEHPNIVRVHAFGLVDDAVPYIVMDYVEGQNLESLVQENGPLSVQQSCDLIEKIADALHTAHQLGITHRDIKPGNIILANGDCPILLDFGVAKFSTASSEQGITKTAQIVGTPAYLSPEQSAGKPGTAKSDMYALSCVLFFLLSGKPLYSGQSDLEIMLKHATELPDFAGLKIGQPLKQFLAKGMAKNPDDRFADMKEFAEELHKLDREI
ncbi:MAG: serine/threonine protein kinase, partial [Candidatus Obscuribacterales bacterium]|nr:serine/threonine protein kinase [Candidatus Obscuribacterales bacterium]